MLKAHGLRQLCSTLRPRRSPSSSAGRCWPAAYFHSKQHDKASKMSCRSTRSWKGKLCATDITKTLAIVNEDQEMATTARPVLRGERRQKTMRWSFMFLTLHCTGMPPTEPASKKPQEGHGTALMPRCSERHQTVPDASELQNMQQDQEP